MGVPHAGHRYRRDVDGLRAVAVIPVVLFHSGLTILSGGFVGVDVFFVISGYLITSIIWGEINQGRFSIVRFYERRVRRIFPALFVVLVFCLAASAILYLPSDFRRVPRSVIAALGFVSNILFWMEAGYFDAPSALKPLLHTWSLAVEEQYYLFFPLLMAFLHARWPRFLIPAIVVLALLSFALSLVAVVVAPAFAFYMAPTRIWELFAGSVLALGVVPAIRGPMVREIAAAAGLVLILVAVFVLSEAVPFPGPAALLPVLGSVLIIHAGEGTWVGRLLGNPLPVFIGLISYSLYLWHWPIIVFTTYYKGELSGVGDMLGVVAASLVAATLSWYFIERPFRLRSTEQGHFTRRQIFRIAAAGSAALAVAAGAAWSAGGWPSRLAPEVVRLDEYSDASSPRRAECHRENLSRPIAESCRYGAPVDPTVALWGDSHGVELVYALGEIASSRGISIQQFTFSGCSPALGFRGADEDCARFNEQTLRYLAERPQIGTVIWVARFDADHRRSPGFIAAARRAIERLRDTGKRVVIVYPVATQPHSVPQALARLSARGGDFDSFGTPAAEFRRRTAAAISMLDAIQGDNIVRVRTDRLLCGATRCRAQANRVPLYFDDHHLSIYGARMVAAAANPVWFERPAGNSALVRSGLVCTPSCDVAVGR